MHTYMPSNSLFDGPVTNLLSILSVLMRTDTKAIMISDLALLLLVL